MLLSKSLEKDIPRDYAHGPKLKDKHNNRVSVKKLTSYIARYASHPAIAESRILKVDYSNATITYFYDPHEDDLYDIVEECWDSGPYPISYCPHCDKPKFVPIDIYNKKKKK